jgi:molybdate transport system substrate-binding protein
MTTQTTTTAGVTIKLFSSGSTAGALRELIPQFERATGHKVVISNEPGKLMLERIRRGDTGDLLLTGSGVIEELAKEGHIVRGSERTLARCGVGVAVRRGVPKPDISSVEAFKRALIDAKSVAHTTSGASGIHLMRVIDEFGIASTVKAKARTQPGGLVGEILARGEADLAVQQIPELLAVDGIDFVGPLPPELQVTSVVSAALFTRASQPAAARALLDYLSSPAAARAYKASGLEPL